MPLDLRGKIAAAEIGFYVPIAIICLVLTFRYGFRRDAGWFFLFFFALSKLPPIWDGIAMIAGVSEGESTIGLRILEAGKSPLGMYASYMHALVRFMQVRGVEYFFDNGTRAPFSRSVSHSLSKAHFSLPS